MPVYAPAPAFADRRRHPRALTAIVVVHAALIGAVMSVKMDLPIRVFDRPTIVDLIPEPEPPPPEPQPQPDKQPPPREAVIDRAQVVVPIPIPDPVPLDTTPLPLPIPDFGELPGNSVVPQPQPTPSAEPVRVGPRFATPAGDVRPPYPVDKRRLEEEAVLRLRLSIDQRGRVVAVEPVGRADRSFLEAARRHIVRHWRYKPATEDGRAVASSTVITLRFELED